MTLRVRLILTLCTFLILRNFFSAPDAALLAFVVLLTITMSVFNLSNVSQHNEIAGRVKVYLDTYFQERARGTSVDDAAYELAKSRYPLSQCFGATL